MSDLVTDEAVEAALDVRDGYPDSPGCDDAVIGALEAAAPHIAKQATADLRAGIEALRDEWRATGLSSKEHRMSRFTYTECADALDALLRGAK